MVTRGERSAKTRGRRVFFWVLFLFLYGCAVPVHQVDRVMLPLPALETASAVASAAEPSLPETETAVLPASPDVSSPEGDASTGDLRSRIEAKLTRDFPVVPILQGEALLRGMDELRSFYADRAWRPAWFLEGVPVPAVPAFLRALGKAEEEGLFPEDYHLKTIHTLLGSLEKLPAERKSAMTADLEILLTDAYLSYTTHLYHGRMEPGRLTSQWPVQKRAASKLPGFDDIPDAGQFERRLEGLLPAYPEYRQLRVVLARYRRIEAAGGWPVISGGKLMKGQRNPRVASLKRRLFLSGELSALPVRNRDLFDAALEKAVRSFQRAHNLKEDGVAGGETLRLMNIPVRERIGQIRLNMERWRWMPRNSDRFILVNIPAFSMKVVEKGKVVLKMKTIVGKQENPTPSFGNRMTHIEINPTWNVPTSIVRKEIIPKVKRNPGYLSSEQIRIYQDWRPGSKEISPGSLDWKKIDPRSFPYHLVQDPGPKNPLGRIKFLFPNSHDVYMHDTPSRHLFNRQGRTFSHGCIRLEKPIDLAEYLLRNDTGWKKAQIMKKINSGQRLLIALRNPIPVHLVYFTVWSDETGLVYFRDDLYEYDRYLGKAMNHQQGKTGGFLF